MSRQNCAVRLWCIRQQQLLRGHNLMSELAPGHTHTRTQAHVSRSDLNPAAHMPVELLKPLPIQTHPVEEDQSTAHVLCVLLLSAAAVSPYNTVSVLWL